MRDESDPIEKLTSRVVTTTLICIMSQSTTRTSPSPQKVLLLHGNRQTGQLLLGRMAKLRKRLLKELQLELIAPDAPFAVVDRDESASNKETREQQPPSGQSALQLQWWNRQGNAYIGLEQSLERIHSVWRECIDRGTGIRSDFCGIIGFSQGARLAHLAAIAHAWYPNEYFVGLQFVILVAGYDAPLPDGFHEALRIVPGDVTTNTTSSIPSLHVWGERDKLITPEQSQTVMNHDIYHSETWEPQRHIHEGGHHVPMKAADVRRYIDFIQQVMMETAGEGGDQGTANKQDSVQNSPASCQVNSIMGDTLVSEPDEENAQAQMEEVEALSVIYPDEFVLLSDRDNVPDDGFGGTYRHPIRFKVRLPSTEDNNEGHWPPHPIALEFVYPFNYPSDSIPSVRLVHDNNVMEFSTAQVAACVRQMTEAAQAEEGMPCVMSMIQAAREYFESGAMLTLVTVDDGLESGGNDEGAKHVDSDDGMSSDGPAASVSSVIKLVSKERIQQCTLEGLEIAESLLRQGGLWTEPSGS